ncbi:MAG TPA: hypothetical protein VFW64_14895 [Pseudonocardiaceae bacterium]|nr:hypothetical protein [Pseudonocardiaceae bacterium]
MHADAPQQAQDRWCDAEGTRITLFCKVEQVAENPEDGALFSRLHQRGEVVGRSLDLIYIRFDGEGQVIGMRPRLLCVLSTENVRKGRDR